MYVRASRQQRDGFGANLDAMAERQFRMHAPGAIHTPELDMDLADLRQSGPTWGTRVGKAAARALDYCTGVASTASTLARVDSKKARS